MHKKIFIISTVLFTLANAPRTFASYDDTPPTCNVSQTLAAPNEKIVFTPTSPYGNSAKDFTWKGETNIKSTGPIALSFIYPGDYTIVLRANGYDSTYSEVTCPTVSVRFDTPLTSTTTLPASYPYPFATSSTKALIPQEMTPYPETCTNFLEDIPPGYSDDVRNPKEGVIYILQTFLKREGFLKVNPTGYFGPLTKAAVKAYQKSMSINTTGYVGPLTREAIKNQTCLG